MVTKLVEDIKTTEEIDNFLRWKLQHYMKNAQCNKGNDEQFKVKHAQQWPPRQKIRPIQLH